MFKTFPEFSKLTLKDRVQYEALINVYPPVSEISFPTMMTWWNTLGTASVAQLNGGLVLSYWLPGDPLGSGLSFVGIREVDESLCSIFDYLRERSEPPRLVHVSEFVINAIRYPELFKFVGERDYDEYIVPVSALYSLKLADSPIRAKVKKLQAKLESRIQVKSLDISSYVNQGLVLARAAEWWSKANRLTSPKLVEESMNLIVKHAASLGMEAICLYIDGELVGFMVYKNTHDPKYVTANYCGADPSIPGLYDYLPYACGQHFANKGIEFINVDFDLGDHFMRAKQLTMAPSNYFRKYTVEPV